jgi:hypothetical protein
MNFHILGIGVLSIGYYYFPMSIYSIENDRVVKLLDGVAVVDDRDKERIISVIDALDFACEKMDPNEGVKNGNRENAIKNPKRKMPL